jgi:protein-S-isoprenylcysteine O-methyltransferase Ste14
MQLYNNKEIRKSFFKAMLLMTVLVVIMASFFFSSAGRYDIPRAWYFFISMIIYFYISIIVLYKFNPTLIAERLKMKKDAKKWDRILMRITNLFGVYIPIVIAGLDVGRFRWSYLNMHFLVIGYILWILSNFFSTYAMTVNPHFEPTVRIQNDRNHRVVTTGPYRYIRHPGYLGGILFYISTPLIIGSTYAFIPEGIAIILTIIRTILEDKTLQNELDGYLEYSKKVKYKLIPGIW